MPYSLNCRKRAYSEKKKTSFSNLAKIRFHNCARTQALFQNRSERGTHCEKQLTQAPPFLTFSSAERLEPFFKINIDEGQGGKIMANWTFLRRPLRAKQLRNLIRKRHTYLNNFSAARAKWLYTIWINIVSRGRRCIQRYPCRTRDFCFLHLFYLCSSFTLFVCHFVFCIYCVCFLNLFYLSAVLFSTFIVFVFFNIIFMLSISIYVCIHTYS